MFSGLIKSRKAGLTWGYGIITPVEFKFRSSTSADAFGNFINDAESPGDEEFVGNYGVRTDLFETLFLFGSGYRLSERLSVGAALNVTLRSHVYTRDIGTKVFFSPPELTDELTTSSIQQVVDYYNVRAAIKFGASYNINNMAFGLTFLTPSISLFGNGYIFADYSAYNVMLQDVDERTNAVGVGSANKVKTNFKSPWSLGGGFSQFWDGSSINVSFEYFGEIPAYTVLDAGDVNFLRPSTIEHELSEDSLLSVLGGNKSVFNIALGYEREISDIFRLMLGIRTNGSYVEKELMDQRAIYPIGTTWDIGYLNVGGRFSNDRNDLTIGLQFGYGVDNERAFYSVGRPEGGDEPVFDITQEFARVRYFSMGVILGWNYLFRRPAEPEVNPHF